MPPLQNTAEAFASQLKEGHYNELRVALYFMLRGCLTRIGFTDGRYDIQVQSPKAGPFHVEVKWDKRGAETGNLYFEVENTRQRQPSGVMSTSADWWAHVVGDQGEALLLKVDALRLFLEQGKFRSVNTGGDDSNSRGLLVPRSRILQVPGAIVVGLPTVEGFFGQVFRAPSPGSVQRKSPSS